MSNILPGVLSKRGFGAVAFAGLALVRANQWFTEHLPLHAASLKAVRLKDGILWVEATHSIALTEASHQSKALADAIKREVPGIPLQSVRVTRA